MASTSLEYLVTLHEYVKQSGGKTFQCFCYVKGGFIAGGSFFCNLQVWLHLDNVFFLQLTLSCLYRPTQNLLRI